MCTPVYVVAITAQVTGMITPVHFREGQFVEVVAAPADEECEGQLAGSADLSSTGPVNDDLTRGDLWEALCGRAFLIDVGDSIWTRLTL